MMPMVGLMSRQPAAAFADLAALKRQACGADAAAPSKATIRAFRDLCQHALGSLSDKADLQAALTHQQEFYPFWFSPPPAPNPNSVIDSEELPIYQTDLD
jgi:hypothetical protein